MNSPPSNSFAKTFPASVTSSAAKRPPTSRQSADRAAPSLRPIFFQMDKGRINSVRHPEESHQNAQKQKKRNHIACRKGKRQRPAMQQTDKNTRYHGGNEAIFPHTMYRKQMGEGCLDGNDEKSTAKSGRIKRKGQVIRNQQRRRTRQRQRDCNSPKSTHCLGNAAIIAMAQASPAEIAYSKWGANPWVGSKPYADTTPDPTVNQRIPSSQTKKPDSSRETHSGRSIL